MEDTTLLASPACENGGCLLQPDVEEVTASALPQIPNYTPLARFTFNFLSPCLSPLFLGSILLGAQYNAFCSLTWFTWCWCRYFKSPDEKRPFYRLEQERRHIPRGDLKCDIKYYARRVGLESDEFKIETEDGFILTMQHIVDRRPGAPHWKRSSHTEQKLMVEKYPVLLLHGLMQSAGAFCVHEESSLAFYLCKEGYDIWLGNNRGYFKPEHVSLKPNDHGFWKWNLRDMGCYDLPAMINYVRDRTGRAKVTPLLILKHAEIRSVDSARGALTRNNTDFPRPLKVPNPPPRHLALPFRRAGTSSLLRPPLQHVPVLLCTNHVHQNL